MTSGPTPVATGRQIAKGAAWLMGFKLLDKSIGLVSTLILARLLTPSDFGLVAMAVSIVALLELMGAFGFDSALIQRQDTQRSHYDTAWTFNVIFGASIALLLVAVAIPAAAFYREPRLELMLPAMAVGAFVGGFENIGTVAFRKELNFRMEFVYLFIKRVAVFVVVVTLAYTLRSFWALIWATVAGKCMAVLISYRLHPYRPRLSLAARKDLFGFSKWLFLSNLIQFLHSRSTDFILGRTVGSHGLGVYNLAAEIAAMPSTELIAPLNRAVYPAYAQLNKTHDKLVARFLEVYGLICLIAFPVAVGLFCLSDLIVPLLLGNQWLEAVPIMQILGLCGLVGALQGNMYVVMAAVGRPKANTMLLACIVAVSLPLVTWASLNFGLIGAAWAYFASSFVSLFSTFFVFHRVVRVGFWRIFSVMWRPLLSALFMGWLVYLFDSNFYSEYFSLNAFGALLILVLSGIFFYSFGVIFLWFCALKPKGPELVVMRFVGSRVFFRV